MVEPDQLRVRAYHVPSGDVILIGVPDRAAGGTVAERHLLIDAGTATRRSGDGRVLKRVSEDIATQLNGTCIDLYILMHAHTEYIHGLWRAHKKLGLDFCVDHLWLTASAEPGYDDRYPRARLGKLLFQELHAYLATRPRRERNLFKMLLANSPSTASAVDFLRQLTAKTAYVHRAADLDGKHSFGEARLEIWAPEEDISGAYSGVLPLVQAIFGGAAAPRVISRAGLIPPEGVNAGAFYNLVDRRASSVSTNLPVHRAANSTGVVVCLEWRGSRLLFPGDAGLACWHLLDRHGKLKAEVLARGRPHVMLSMHEKVRQNVPGDALLAALAASDVEVHSTAGVDPGAFVELTFPGARPGSASEDRLALVNQPRLDLAE